MKQILCGKKSSAVTVTVQKFYSSNVSFGIFFFLLPNHLPFFENPPVRVAVNFDEYRVYFFSISPIVQFRAPYFIKLHNFFFVQPIQKNYLRFFGPHHHRIRVRDGALPGR